MLFGHLSVCREVSNHSSLQKSLCLTLPVWLFSFMASLAPDCSRLLSSPNKQRSGPYSDWHSRFWSRMSEPAVPLVKALWQTIIFINIHDYVINNKCCCCRTPKTRAKTRFLPASSLTNRKILQNALSLLDNPLNIHHFGMWKVDWLSWRSGLYSGTKIASWS